MKKRIAVLLLMGIAAISILIEGCGRGGCSGGGECGDYDAVNCDKLCLTDQPRLTLGGWVCDSLESDCKMVDGDCKSPNPGYNVSGCCHHCSSP